MGRILMRLRGLLGRGGAISRFWICHRIFRPKNERYATHLNFIAQRRKNKKISQIKKPLLFV